MPVFCNNCGSENRDTSKFCSGCGGGLQASSPSGPLTAGTILENRYRIIGVIKQGKLGVFYKAVDYKLDGLCAILELDKKNEQVLDKLERDNLSEVIDCFLNNEIYYLVMNYVEGEDPEVIMERKGLLLFTADFLETLKCPLGTELILIPGGTFRMGSEKDDDEKPVHSVTIDNFYIDRYPVTNRGYKLFRPGHKGEWSEPDFPVETVNWYDAIEYCNWLSDREGLSRCYSGSGDNIKMDMSKNGYRLPTEAEWEYACRAGTTTDYYWGNELDGVYCWYRKNSNNTVHLIGQWKPNAWGLYDMSGNVLEWCWDWYDYDYRKSSSNNPTGPISGSSRVLRGGSWFNPIADNCRSACRGKGRPDYAAYTYGFRPVRKP